MARVPYPPDCSWDEPPPEGCQCSRHAHTSAHRSLHWQIVQLCSYAWTYDCFHCSEDGIIKDAHEWARIKRSPGFSDVRGSFMPLCRPCHYLYDLMSDQLAEARKMRSTPESRQKTAVINRQKYEDHVERQKQSERMKRQHQSEDKSSQICSFCQRVCVGVRGLNIHQSKSGCSSKGR
jgi:hypothetical protein